MCSTLCSGYTFHSSPVVQGQDRVSEPNHLLLEVKGRHVVYSQCIVSEGYDEFVDVCHDNDIGHPREL